MKRNAVVLAVILLGIMILIGTQTIAVAQPNQPKDVRYTVTEVGVLPGCTSSYLPVLGSINNGGFVAGYSYNGPFGASSIDFYLTSRAFIGDHRGVVTLLPTPNGYAGANAFGLNDRNQVFGMANKLDDSGNLLVSPVVWDQYGNPTLLENLPDSPWYDANAINNNGDVVGEVYLPPDYMLTVPVYWHRGKIARLPLPDGAVQAWANGINDLGVIVGAVDYGTVTPSGAPDYHMYAWTPQGGHHVGADLGDNSGYWLEPRAINNLGQITGGAEYEGGTFRAFAWTDGQLKDLGTLPGGRGSFTWSRINIWGQVLGQSDRPGQSDAAFLWQDDTIIDLNEVVPPDTPTLLTPGGINDVGQIAVDSYSRHYTTTRGFILTPVADDSR